MRWCVYPKAALLTAFPEDRKVAQTFTATLARQVMGLRTRLEQRNIRSARERHYLVPNASADGGAVKLRGTVKDLANKFGPTHGRCTLRWPRLSARARSGGRGARFHCCAGAACDSVHTELLPPALKRRLGETVH
jgi:hypothetical protein